VEVSSSGMASSAENEESALPFEATKNFDEENSSFELEILATKTNGKLRLDICEDYDENKRRGLFVQDFLRPCLVEEEGLIFLGDELIAINKHTVDGCSIDQLVEVLRVADQPGNETVLLGIRRRNKTNYQSNSFEDENLYDNEEVFLLCLPSLSLTHDVVQLLSRGEPSHHRLRAARVQHQ
jgi:hypothetical protein